MQARGTPPGYLSEPGIMFIEVRALETKQGVILQIQKGHDAEKVAAKYAHSSTSWRRMPWDTRRETPHVWRALKAGDLVGALVEVHGLPPL